MSVLTGKALHEQLSVIMGALTTAAVAEICELVDEGFAVLRMEINRSHQENDDLRKKLHLIESIVVRGGGGTGVGTGGSTGGGTGGSGTGGSGTGGKDAAAATEAAGAAGAAEVEPGVAAAAEGSQQPETVHQQRDSVGGSTAAAPGGDGGSAVVLREELPDVVLIKDEDSDSDDSLEEDNKASSDGGSTAAAAAREPPVGRRAKRRWRGSEESTPKVSVYALDSPRSEPGRSARLGGADEMEAGESVCSYSSQLNADVQLVHQECSLLPGANRQTYFANGALMESPTNRAELDLSLTWTKPSKHHVAFAPFHHNDHVDGDAFGIKLVSVSGSTSTDCQLSESSNSALEYDDADAMNFALYREPAPPSQAGGGGGGGARGKRFMCSVCNRTYATSQNLDVHMRIHTGERPFGCNQCGKKFTQSAHLKSHLIVHSGERPYACTLCSRSFIVKYSLKLHMKKCHLDV